MEIQHYIPEHIQDWLVIDNGNYLEMSGCYVRIIDIRSNVVFASEVNSQEFIPNMKDFGSEGIYFIQILNENQELIDVRKILLNLEYTQNTT